MVRFQYLQHGFVMSIALSITFLARIATGPFLSFGDSLCAGFNDKRGMAKSQWPPNYKWNLFNVLGVGKDSFSRMFCMSL